MFLFITFGISFAYFSKTLQPTQFLLLAQKSTHSNTYNSGSKNRRLEFVVQHNLWRCSTQLVLCQPTAAEQMLYYRLGSKCVNITYHQHVNSENSWPYYYMEYNFTFSYQHSTCFQLCGIFQWNSLILLGRRHSVPLNQLYQKIAQADVL